MKLEKDNWVNAIVYGFINITHMKLEKDNWVIVILYGFLCTALGSFFLLTIVTIYLYAIGLNSDLVTILSYPQIISLDQILSVERNGTNISVVGLTGDVALTLKSKFVITLYTFAVVCSYICIAAVINLLRKIIYSVYKKEPFSKANCKRLNAITWIIVLTPVFLYICSLILVHSLPDTFYVYNDKISINAKSYIFEGLVLGGLVYTISQVYIKGVELKHEQDLTV